MEVDSFLCLETCQLQGCRFSAPYLMDSSKEPSYSQAEAEAIAGPQVFASCSLTVCPKTSWFCLPSDPIDRSCSSPVTVQDNDACFLAAASLLLPQEQGLFAIVCCSREGLNTGRMQAGLEL